MIASQISTITTQLKKRAKSFRAQQQNSLQQSRSSTNFDVSSISSIDEAAASEAQSNLTYSENEKWSKLASRLLDSKKTSVWERVGILPCFVRKLFDKAELRYGTHISAEERKMYYSKFYSRGSGSTTLSTSEMEQLLGPDELGIAKSVEEARTQIQQLLVRQSAAYETPAGVEFEADHLDFEFFTQVVCEIQNRTVKFVEPIAKQSKSVLSRLLPVDPDSSLKQGWDVFCLLLLFYCSFSVPYGIAFLDTDANGALSILDMFGLAVDMIFMFDIFLSFITAIEVDGIVVRDLRIISATYSRLSPCSSLIPFESSFLRRPPPPPSLPCCVRERVRGSTARSDRFTVNLQ